MRDVDAPILLLDVMSTLVYDPFAVELPAFFDVDLETLIRDKDPTAWPEFERRDIDEETFFDRFFRRGGIDFDTAELKQTLRDAYRWIGGTEALLAGLSEAGVEMHALSNYPCWYEMIEEKLELSRFLDWSFVSWKTGVRKPDPRAYLGAAEALGVGPSSCLFVDDRRTNVEAAREVGMDAIRFESAAQLRRQLHRHDLPVRPTDPRS